jgi:hypothetical protein
MLFRLNSPNHALAGRLARSPAHARGEHSMTEALTMLSRHCSSIVLGLTLIVILLSGCQSRSAIVITARDESGKVAIVNPEALAHFEGDLLERFAEPGAPDEAFAVQRSGAWTGDMSLLQVLIWRDAALLRFQVSGDEDCFYQRELSAQEVQALRRWVRDNQIDSQPAYDRNVMDGEWYRYIHVTRSEAVDASINNPFVQGQPEGPYQRFLKYLETLADLKDLPVHYRTARLPAGVEVLYASAADEATAIWAQGDDVRIRIRPRDRTTESGWRTLRAGKVGEEAAEPYAEAPEPYRGVGHEFGLGEAHLTARWGQQFIGTGTKDWKQWSTWLCAKGAGPVMLFPSAMQEFVVTPAGFLVGTLDGRLVDYDLNQRKTVEFHDPADIADYVTLRAIPETGDVLIAEHNLPPGGTHGRRMRLLDPRTGVHHEVRDPWTKDTLLPNWSRPMQPTTQPATVWAAYCPDKQHDTLLGKLDLSRGEFDWAQINDLRFYTVQMWIDQSTRRIYVIQNGHVIRLPLPTRSATGREW